MATRILILLLVVGFSFKAFSQSIILKRSTRGSAGGVIYQNNAKIAITHTIGQSSLITAIGSSRITLLQGFQQPELVAQSYLSSTFKVSIFPNPSHGKVFLAIPSSKAFPYMISLLGLNGTLIQQQVIRNENKLTLDYSLIEKGAYILKIIDEAHHSYSTLLMLQD